MITAGVFHAINRRAVLAKWALGRGSVVIVLGLVGFLGEPLTRPNADTGAIGFLLVVSAAVAALIVLMLGDEGHVGVYEGTNTRQFITRPAKPRVVNAALQEGRPLNRPVPSSNRPGAVPEEAEEAEETAGMEKPEEEVA